MSADSNAEVKCVLVGDLEDDSSLLTAQLSRADVELMMARSGPEALELLLVNDVALALIDLQMPDRGGFLLAERMRASTRTRSVPIIFISAGLPEGYPVFEGYDAGAVDFVFKPVDGRILRHKAEPFLQLHRQRKELSRQLERLRQSEELRTRLVESLQEAQAERERLAEKLAETLRFNETFVAAVGHDLRNPLNAILMATELLVRRTQDPPLLKMARRVQASGRRIASMIDDLSDMARARLSGGIAVRHQAVDLLSVASRALGEYTSTYPERGVELQSNGDLAGQWDGPRIERVISKLLGNALHHGDDTRNVTLSLDGSAAEEVVLAVHNWGHIEPELVPYIFEPFRAGRKDRTHSEGLGLGLFIVRQIVLAHGGSVTVTSSEAVGTTFRVQLPRGPAGAVVEPRPA
jgi:signal transduction histidine kinase